jgi:hypothetical protein
VEAHISNHTPQLKVEENTAETRLSRCQQLVSEAWVSHQVLLKKRIAYASKNFSKGAEYEGFSSLVEAEQKALQLIGNYMKKISLPYTIRSQKKLLRGYHRFSGSLAPIESGNISELIEKNVACLLPENWRRSLETARLKPSSSRLRIGTLTAKIPVSLPDYRKEMAELSDCSVKRNG